MDLLNSTVGKKRHRLEYTLSADVFNRNDKLMEYFVDFKISCNSYFNLDRAFCGYNKAKVQGQAKAYYRWL